MIFSAIEDQPHVTWLDNFSKIYNRKSATLQQGIWHDCLWTGVAVNKWNPSIGFEADHVNLSALLDDSGTVISAMPSALGTAPSVRFLKQQMQKMKEEGGMFQYESSICKKYDVRNIPLKHVVSEVEDPELFNILIRRVDGLKHFYPKQLLKKNIGSNKGLLQILWDKLSETIATRPRKYSIIVADVDIFKRILKVFDITVSFILHHTIYRIYYFYSSIINNSFVRSIINNSHGNSITAFLFSLLHNLNSFFVFMS